MSAVRSQLSDIANAVDSYLLSIDIDSLSGEDVSAALSLVTPVLRRLNFHSVALGARGVSINQHNAAGARSGASWFGSLTGISEVDAGRSLGAVKSMELNPDVYDVAESGALSFDKAALITGVAHGSVPMTQYLMNHADSDSFESLRRRGQDRLAENESTPERQQRRRHSQYISIEHDLDDMAIGRFRLLPELAAAWIAKWNVVEQQAQQDNQKLLNPLPRSAASAEAFSSMLTASGGSTKAIVNYHVRLEDWQQGWPQDPSVCEVAGVGLVPTAALQTISEHPAMALLITARNKLLWYSEATYKPDGPLPEFIKRAVKASQQHRCSGSGCVKVAEEVDHDLARTNGGNNAFENLQALCQSDHVAKTKHDAPWTAGGIYGKQKAATPPKGPPLADTG